MGISYDLFASNFLSKITDFDFLNMLEDERTAIMDGYMKSAITSFKYICKYDLAGNMDDNTREITIDVEPSDLDEIVDIVAEGMVVQWLKTYLNKQELLQNVLNTRDYTTYSPAELLMRVGNAYASAKREYDQLIREYSYNNTDLTELHK